MDYSLKSNRIQDLITIIKERSIPKIEILKLLIQSYIESSDTFFESDGYLEEFTPECFLLFNDILQGNAQPGPGAITKEVCEEVYKVIFPEKYYVTENSFISTTIIYSLLNSLMGYDEDWDHSNFLNPLEDSFNLTLISDYAKDYNHNLSKEGLNSFYYYCYNLYISKIENIIEGL